MESNNRTSIDSPALYLAIKASYYIQIFKLLTQCSTAKQQLYWLQSAVLAETHAASSHNTNTIDVPGSHTDNNKSGEVQVNGKSKFLYTEPAQIALHVTHWQPCSIENLFVFSGKNSATLQLMREYYSCKNIHQCL